MFESNQRKGLSEDQFEAWLQEGRAHAMGYHFALILWNELDQAYRIQYLIDRSEIFNYRTSATEYIIAAYDVYSESRIQMDQTDQEGL